MKRSTNSATALLVIDCQESFRQRAYWNDAEARPFFGNIQRIVDACADAGLPIVQIFHEDSHGAFARSSGFVRTFDGLGVAPSVTFYKTKHSAFIGTKLEEWLRDRGVERILVTGVRTEQCCETTTRHGSDLGFEVDFLTEATLTFGMKHEATGRTFSPAEIREMTELVLADRFARIRSIADLVAELGADEHARPNAVKQG